MQQMMETGTAKFIPGIQEEKIKYSWKNMCDKILEVMKR
jgi:hypothetical protein